MAFFFFFFSFGQWREIHDHEVPVRRCCGLAEAVDELGGAGPGAQSEEAFDLSLIQVRTGACCRIVYVVLVCCVMLVVSWGLPSCQSVLVLCVFPVSVFCSGCSSCCVLGFGCFVCVFVFVRFVFFCRSWSTSWSTSWSYCCCCGCCLR